jgi:2-phospho-L-lactate guanylyltransferase
MTITAVIPVKGLDSAKHRLAAVLDGRQRAALMVAMLEDVLAALLEVPAFSPLVLSRDPQALRLARERSIEALSEPEDAAGESATVAFAASHLVARGIECMAVLPADAPLMTPKDLQQMAALEPARQGVVLVPAHDGGTNGLLAKPPTAIPFHFGPDSLRKHQQEAQAQGLSCHIVRLASLERDLDTPEDLEWFLRHGLGKMTHDALQRFGVARL